LEKVMLFFDRFDKIQAYPDGSVHYFCGDKVITTTKTAPPIIRIKTDKDIYGLFDGPGDIPGRGGQFIADELLDDFPPVD